MLWKSVTSPQSEQGKDSYIDKRDNKLVAIQLPPKPRADSTTEGTRAEIGTVLTKQKVIKTLNPRIYHRTLGLNSAFSLSYRFNSSILTDGATFLAA